MTSRKLSSRDARVLMLGTLVVTAIVVLSRGVPALRGRAERYREGAARAAAQAGRVEWSLRNADGTRRALERTRSQLAAYDSAIVEDETPSAASARLAELVSDAAEVAEARLGAVQLGADTIAARGTLARVTARASVTGDLMAIAQMLQALEEGPRLLAVRELGIVPMQTGAVRGQPEVLQAELLVEGLYRPSRGKQIR
jgi:hypothetical protein